MYIMAQQLIYKLHVLSERIWLCTSQVGWISIPPAPAAAFLLLSFSSFHRTISPLLCFLGYPPLAHRPRGKKVITGRLRLALDSLELRHGPILYAQDTYM
jgi:hypothetical protein